MAPGVTIGNLLITLMSFGLLLVVLGVTIGNLFMTLIALSVSLWFLV